MLEGNFKNSLSNVCQKIERKFFDVIDKEHAHNREHMDEDERIDHSGTCATLLTFVNRVCYIAHIGDGRCIVSKDKG